MHGHRSIIAARRAGFKPNPIFFEVDLRIAPPRYDFEDTEYALATKQFAHVELSLEEKWRLADLLFVTGCTVYIQGRRWGNAIHELAQKIAANGATHIVVFCLEDGPLLRYREGEWSHV